MKFMWSLLVCLSVVVSSADVAFITVPGDTFTPVKGTASWLSIFTINDVYSLSALPHLVTARQAEFGSRKGSSSFTALAGDFIASYAMAALDFGSGMLKMMEKLGVDVSIFGNHETDHGIEVLCQRIQESNLTWVSSNMDLPCGKDIVLPFTITTAGNKRVGVLGLLSNDVELYNPQVAPFGGAPIKDPIAAATFWTTYLHEVEGVDAVVLITHQSLEQDVLLAHSGNYSLIIGGHDDDEFLGTVNGCTIIKGGVNALKYAIIDLFWLTDDAVHPVVTAALKVSAEHAPDAEMQAFADQQYENAIAGAKETLLSTLPDSQQLSTRNVRREPTELAKFLLDHLVAATPGAECSFMCAGNVRGSRDYRAIEELSHFSLVEIFPFDSNVPLLVQLPGWLISEVVRYSRSLSTGAHSKYLQLDGGMVWDASTQALTHIAGRPVDADRLYSCIVNEQLLQGMDLLEPLDAYLRLHPDAVDPTQQRVEIKARLLPHFFALQVPEILTSLGDERVDADGDGNIDRAELAAAYETVYHRAPTSFVVNSLMDALTTLQPAPAPAPAPLLASAHEQEHDVSFNMGLLMSWVLANTTAVEAVQHPARPDVETQFLSDFTEVQEMQELVVAMQEAY